MTEHPMPDRDRRAVASAAAGRWTLPAFCVLLGAVVGALVWRVGGDAGLGLGFAGIMVAYAAVLGFGGRSETVRIMRGELGDERRELIDLRSAAIAYYAVITVAVVGFVVEMVRGDAGPFTVVCAVGGATQILATAVLRRRI